MGNKKYFFFDIDGTLQDIPTKVVTPSSIQAIKELKEKGHFVAIATGRAHYKAIDFSKSIGIKDMVCNGGHGIVIDDCLVDNEPLDREVILTILKQAEQLGYGILVATNDSKEVYAKDTLFLQQVGYRKEPTLYFFDPDFDFAKVPAIYKAYISISKQEEYKLTTKNKLGALRFVDEYLMFQHDDKKWGIERMIQEVDGKIEDVVVFGDDYNDLVMFDPRWYSIAMGNACQELKDKANCICDTITNDGIYKICKEKGWI